MRCQHTFLRLLTFLLLFLLTNSATVKDVFNLNPEPSSRVPRDNKYYPGRYSSSTSNLGSLNRAIKPEESPEAQEATQNPVEKRCTRCDSTYSDTRYPSYDYRPRYDDRRYKPYEFDDRRYERYDRYDRYDDRRYEDRDFSDRYEKRPPYDRYDRERYDRYDGGDRYGGRDRYDGRDRYEGGDRYGGRDRYDGRDRDRYSDRDYDRGFGYDNRGYDYRDRGYSDTGSFPSSGYEGGRGSYPAARPEAGAGYWGTGGYASGWNYGGGGGGRGGGLGGVGGGLRGEGGGRDDGRDRDRYDYDGFKPWDETYRGSAGWDSQGRGYYFATGIPEVGAEHWGNRGYAGGERDRYGGGYYRPRDPYDGYRSTSYLYARPSSTTTDRPPNSGDNDSGVTQSSQDNTSG